MLETHETLFSYAYRKTWKGAGPFGGEEKEHVTTGVVEAASADEAARAAIRKSSVLELEYGVSVEVVRISWGKATRRVAKYDQEPFLDHALVNPKAKLVIQRA